MGSLIGCVRSGKQADSPACVYVKKRCATVTGIVDCLRREPDGDVHIELRLDRLGPLLAGDWARLALAETRSGALVGRD